MSRRYRRSRRDPGLFEIATTSDFSRELVDLIEWKRFEDLCRAFYRVKGIRAGTSPLIADGSLKMAARDSKRERFWGCTHFPRCRATLQMRSATP
ncbi:hypothetical protein [Thauera sp.]